MPSERPPDSTEERRAFTEKLMREAGVKPPPLAARAKSFGRSVASGKADPATYTARMDQCLSCVMLKRYGDKLYCGGGCGCGRHPLSELRTKLRFAYVECPLEKQHFSNAKGGDDAEAGTE